jgi:pimeloyl-ACP methyl ester carboxylesterase
MSTAQTAPTLYTTSPTTNVKYAYRLLGPSPSISPNPPLVLQIHFRANMDYWDPLLLNSLAFSRPVLVFDNAGIGRSTGSVPLTYQGWADHIIALVDSLGYTQIDLLGFSMGGCTVQMVALTRPELIRKLIIAGSSASAPGPEYLAENRRTDPDLRYFNALAAANEEEIESAIAYSFFYETDAGRAAARAYWARIPSRTVEPLHLKPLDQEGTERQIAALKEWFSHNPRNSFDRLGELKMPVFVANGDNDVLAPTGRSWELCGRIGKGKGNAQLVVYAGCGHGFLYERAELFAGHVGEFLDGVAAAKL